MLTSAERLTTSALAGIACLMLAGYVADIVRLPFLPIVLVACGAGGALMWWHSAERSASQPSRAELVALLAVLVGFGAYTLWLAWPSLLPVSQGPDLVHHVSLIQFIQGRRTLVHGRALDPYLGEMVRYTPGTHILAATVASLAGTTAIRVLHPILTVIVALKAAIVLLILLRLLDNSRTRLPLALIGAALLLVPHEYTVRSFTFSYFYSQVISEAFTVALLWTLVVWHQHPSRRLLVLFSLFGMAVFYSWPVFLGVPIVALAGMVILRLRGEASCRPLRRAIGDLATALVPITLFAAAYSLPRLSAAGILRANGDVIKPDPQILGWPILALTCIGLAASFRRRRLLPLLAFSAAAVLETLALYEYDSRHRIETYYAARKMFHILIYPAIVAAIVGVSEIADAIAARMSPRLARREVAVAIGIVLLLSFGIRHDVLLARPHSAITEPVLQAGLWAKSTLPSDCVEYLMSHWITAYWLHVDVLGNPRRMKRTVGITSREFDYARSIDRWKSAEGLPYAIVADWDRLPPHAQEAARVLRRFGPAAVVERLGGGVCAERAVPVDRFAR